MTFNELSDEFEKSYQNMCPNTKAAYSNSLRKLRSYYGNQDISLMSVKDFAGTILDRRVLKRMIRLAHEWKYLTEVPSIKIPKERTRTRFLEQDEVKLLLTYVKDPDLNLMIRVAIGTGLRKQNLFNLEWGQIDLQNMHIKVIVKGNKEIYIPIVEELRDALVKHRSSRLIISKEVFPKKNYDKRFRSYLKALKIHGVSFHPLRHTFGSWLAMGGVDIKTIAELMGHESIETTQRYIHIASEHKKAAVETLPKAFFIGG
jgi:integrase